MTDEFTNEFLEWARTHLTDVSAIGLNILIDHIDESHATIAQLTSECDARKADAERLKEANEDLKSRIDDYRQDYIKVVNDQCPTDERHCGCVPILRRENRLLSEDLANTKLELHKYQAVSWISIANGRLPEKFQECIVLDKNKRVHNWIHDDALLPLFAQYTHWMPLPEPLEVTE